MESAFRPEGQVQTSVDPTPMVYERIMARGYPFVAVTRVNVNDPAVNLEHEVQSRSVEKGEPIVLEGFHQQENWKTDMFTFPYLQDNFGNEEILCRDLHNADDVNMTMAQYIETVHGDALGTDAASSSESYAHLGTPIPNNQDSSLSRKPLIYAKDLTCPPTWRSFLMNTILPPFLAYMCENDLNNLNTKLAAENLMVYIGQAGTWTPAHVDQCGAIGHNIMTWADNGSSSIWFMIRSEDKKKAEGLWNSFGQPLDYEGYFADLDELQRATFPVYVVEQKIGDFVMVPSQCVHQVVNLGKATIKVSWNRLTPNCLKTAMNSVLPKYREIARPEGYRIKVIIASTLQAWTKKLETQGDDFGMSKDSFCKAFMEILDLYRSIVEEEWVDLHAMGSDYEPFERPKRLKEYQLCQPAICDFCRSDIWNRQFQCHQCVNDEDAYDLCARCYSLGRGCDHREEGMEFIESFSMESCRLAYCRALAAWNQSKALAGCPGHKPIADTWVVTIVPSAEKDFSPTTLAYRRHSLVNDAKACHICKSKSIPTQMSAECSSCPLSFCELCLYKYYDLIWTDIAAKQAGWKCFRCQGVCPCVQGDRRTATGCAPLEAPHKKSLWFTRPEDDYRNQGGVSDVLGSSGQDSLTTGEDNRNERPKPAHGSHKGKMAKPRPSSSDLVPTTSGFHRKRPLALESDLPFKKVKKMRSTVDEEDNDEWRARPKPVRGSSAKSIKSNPEHTDDLSDINDSSSYRRTLMTGTQLANLKKSRTSHISITRPATSEKLFSAVLGENVDYVKDVAVKAGLSRTLESLSSLHLVTGMGAYEIFQMDRHCASLDPKVRASFRTDFMEKKHRSHSEAKGIEKSGHITSDKQPQDDQIITECKDKEVTPDATSHERSQKRPKEKGETSVHITGEKRPHLNPGEEMSKDIATIARELPQQERKTGRKGHEDSDGEDQRSLHAREEEIEKQEVMRKETPEENAGRNRPQNRRHNRPKKEKETHEDTTGDEQDCQALPLPSKRQSVLSSRYSSRTRKTSRSNASLGRSPSVDVSHNQGREGEGSISPPTLVIRPKRSPRRVSPIVSKFEAKQKALEPEKRATVSRRILRGPKRQIGLSGDKCDIPNHSITNKPEPASVNDMEIENGFNTSGKSKSVLDTSCIADLRLNNDDTEDNVLEAGIIHAPVLFRSQAEGNNIAHIPTNHTSPTSPASPTTPTDVVKPSHLDCKEEETPYESTTSTDAVDLSVTDNFQTTTAIKVTPSTVHETVFVAQGVHSEIPEVRSEIQETTHLPQVQPHVKEELKLRADEEQVKVITSVVDTFKVIKPTTTANGATDKNTNLDIHSNIQSTETSATATATTAVPVAMATNSSIKPTTNTATSVRPIKLVRSSPAHVMLKQLIENSTNITPKTSTDTIVAVTAATTGPVVAGSMAEPPLKPSVSRSISSSSSSSTSSSSSSKLTPASQVSITSTESVVNPSDDVAAATAAKVEGAENLVKIETLSDRGGSDSSSSSSSNNTNSNNNNSNNNNSSEIKAKEFVGRRRRVSSRT
ncbi:hypothetical protein EC991_010462 [Linnemannia zychae]|nr:hypothetical protein EC991_010462 [Linnemannia zychae]